MLCAGAGIGTLAPELGIPIRLCHARVTFRAPDAGLAALQEQSGAYGETALRPRSPVSISTRWDSPATGRRCRSTPAGLWSSG